MVQSRRTPTPGIGGFLDSTLYTLETGFDFFAREMAFALDSETQGGGDADYSVTENSTLGNESIANSTVQGEEVFRSELDDDDITYDDEARQDARDIFRPDPFDPRKADLKQYSELVRMASDNYQMDSSTGNGGNVRQRIQEYEMAKKRTTAGSNNNLGPEISKYKMKPSPEAMSRRNPSGLQPTAMSPTVMKASMNLEKASTHLQAVKEKRRALEQQHIHIQKQLELQRQKSKANEEQATEPNDLKDTLDRLDAKEVSSTRPTKTEDSMEEKLKALERRHRQIEKKKKTSREITEKRDEMEEIQAELDRLIVEELLSSNEEESSKNSDRILGLDTNPIETAVERKRILNEKAHSQLREMMHDQLHLEELQRVVGREKLPTSREEPENDLRIVKSTEEEALLKELEELLSSETL
jgi:hypothetical protein